MTAKAPAATPNRPLQRRGDVARHVAVISADLACLARSHGLETLGYILEMARLEAENLARAEPR
ncbi:MAG TPA: hypothetical protein VFA53_01380 [Xanthobacteraceae bacterium]|nr:hypothetical protein [Xanthobacteraceae bacterium]